jgi:hypothetical protein
MFFIGLRLINAVIVHIKLSLRTILAKAINFQFMLVRPLKGTAMDYLIHCRWLQPTDKDSTGMGL